MQNFFAERLRDGIFCGWATKEKRKSTVDYFGPEDIFLEIQSVYVSDMH